MLSKSLITSENDIEHFVSTHLSEVGIKKQVTTLRVYKKRNRSERLQVEISRSNKSGLEQFVKVSGKTKIEIINLLNEIAELDEF